MRFILYPALVLCCYTLCACTAFQEENRRFFSTANERPGDLQFNVPTAGLIHSPYAPEAGWVDVRGLEPGTLVRCPYTGRDFVVPLYGRYLVNRL